jgi:hypothetical protein
MPRVCVVFEGAVAFLDSKDERLFTKLLEKEHYGAALQLFKLNELAVKVIWDRAWKYDLRIDIITYFGGDEFAEAIRASLEAEELPFNNVWYTRPDILARKATWTQDLQRIYDPFEAHVGLFGQKGRYLTDINQIGRA